MDASDRRARRRDLRARLVPLLVILAGLCVCLWVREATKPAAPPPQVEGWPVQALPGPEPGGPPVAAFPDPDARGLYGYIDRDGRVVIASQFDWADDFDGELALARRGGRYGYLDRGGRLQFTLPRGTELVGPMSEGRVWFRNAHDKWGLCDDQGTVLVPPTYDDVSPFAGGRAAVNVGARPEFPGVMLGGDWGVLGRNGDVIVPIGDPDAWRHSPGPSDDDFHEGLAARWEASAADPGGRKWGYVNRAGKVVIAPAFAEAKDFSEGLAAVRTQRTTVLGKGDTWGYIDKTGKFQIPPTFNEAHRFHEGVARVHVGGKLMEVYDGDPFWKGGEWWLIDARGRQLRDWPDRVR